MADDLFELFDDYAARFARGERPNARDYVERAGDSGDEFAQMLESFLSRAVPPAPDADVRSAAEAWLAGDSPLLALRVRRGVKRAAVVDALVQRLGLDPAKREKVSRYYHELETGQLEPEGVDRGVWTVLAETLSGRIDDLFAWRPKSDATSAVFARRTAPAAEALEAPSRESAPEDEVDRLFTRAR